MQAVVEVDVWGNCLERPAEVSDIVDVTVHVHVTAPRHLQRALDLRRHNKAQLSMLQLMEPLQLIQPLQELPDRIWQQWQGIESQSDNFVNRIYGFRYGSRKIRKR